MYKEECLSVCPVIQRPCNFVHKHCISSSKLLSIVYTFLNHCKRIKQTAVVEQTKRNSTVVEYYSSRVHVHPGCSTNYHGLTKFDPSWTWRTRDRIIMEIGILDHTRSNSRSKMNDE